MYTKIDKWIERQINIQLFGQKEEVNLHPLVKAQFWREKENMTLTPKRETDRQTGRYVYGQIDKYRASWTGRGVNLHTSIEHNFGGKK